MILDALEEYGLIKPLSEAGFYATDKIKRLHEKIKNLALNYGSLIAVSGTVGSGKTTFINELMHDLKKEGKCIVSYSYSSDREGVNVKTLLTAMIIDVVNGDVKARINGAGFDPLIAAGASKIGLDLRASMRAWL